MMDERDLEQRQTKTECSLCPPKTLRCAHYGDRWLCLHEQEWQGGPGLFLCAGEGPQLWDHRGHFGEARESISNIPVSELAASLEGFEEAEQALLKDISRILSS